MNPRFRPNSRTGLPFGALTLGVATLLICLPGCYKRVVHADGIGAEGIEIKQSNRSNSLLDKAVFGDDTPGKKASTRPSGYTPKQ